MIPSVLCELLASSPAGT